MIECKTCHEIKEESQFSRRGDNKTKYRSQCKSCRNSKNAQYRQVNSESLKEYAKQYRTQNPDKRYMACKNWRQNNPDRVYAHVKSYRDRNPFYALMNGQERRKQLQLNGPIEKIDFYTLYTMYKGMCYVCETRIDLTIAHPDPRSKSVEHILSIKQGGTHTLENLAISHLGCNCAKGGG